MNLTSTNGATVTLYAVWNANTSTVAYNNNGGTGSMTSSSHTYGVARNLTTNTFTKTGYTFAGWDTNSAGTTVVHANNASVTNLTSTNGATFNLYAVWQQGQTNVTTLWITGQTITHNPAGNVPINRIPGNALATQLFRVTESGVSNIVWSVNGVTVQSGGDYTFDAQWRSNGTYYIGVSVTKNSKTYSETITVTVN
jgi:uncharacterized repeat protein (TIGR02543 family)